MRMFHRPLLLSVATLALVGCGAAVPRPSCDFPEAGNLSVQGTDRVNPDARGRSLPTIVRVFQLSTIGALEDATFDELWHAPEEALGDAVLSMEEMTYYPSNDGEAGPVIRRPFERNPEANFIVGMAIVRRPAGVSWRSIVELPVPAAAVACAAQQQDPEAPPPPAEISQVRFELDDYRIEGYVTRAPAAASCDGGDLSCLREAGRADPPEAPEAPALEAP